MVATTWLLGRRFYPDTWAADAAALTLALPTVLVSLYTTATLGGYNEILLLGNCVLLAAHEVLCRGAGRRWVWLALGLAAGLGFLDLGADRPYLLPVAVLGLVQVIQGPADRRKQLLQGAYAGGAGLFHRQRAPGGCTT